MVIQWWLCQSLFVFAGIRYLLFWDIGHEIGGNWRSQRWAKYFGLPSRWRHGAEWDDVNGDLIWRFGIDQNLLITPIRGEHLYSYCGVHEGISGTSLAHNHFCWVSWIETYSASNHSQADVHILRYVPAFAYYVTANADLTDIWRILTSCLVIYSDMLVVVKAMWHIYSMTFQDEMYCLIMRYVLYVLTSGWVKTYIITRGGRNIHETSIKPAILGYPLGARVLTQSPAPLPRHKMEDLPSNPWPCHPGLCQGIPVVSGICPESPIWNLTMGRVSIFLHKP